jgi:hypothetical protein
MLLRSLHRFTKSRSQRTVAKRLSRRILAGRRALLGLAIGHLEDRTLPSGFSTYLGGSVFDEGVAVAVDSAGDTYVVGLTAPADFPATVGSWLAHSRTAGSSPPPSSRWRSPVSIRSILEPRSGFTRTRAWGRSP